MTFAQSVVFWLVPLGLALCGVVLLVLGLVAYGFAITLKQRRCKHANCYETMACQVQCSDCGKDLGFVDNWRKQGRTCRPN